jgi:hypothetical protein
MLDRRQRSINWMMCGMMMCCDVFLTMGLSITIGNIITRAKMREVFRMSNVNMVADCLASVFCFHCTLCQTYREMSLRNMWPGGICVSEQYRDTRIQAPTGASMGDQYPQQAVALEVGAYPTYPAYPAQSNPPPQNIGYPQPPPPQGGYSGYGQPPQQQSYGQPPPPAQVYPQSQQTGASHLGYGPQYGSPAVLGYGQNPPAAGYPGYGAPPQAGYGAPPQAGYGAPPQAGYGQPTLEPPSSKLLY